MLATVLNRSGELGDRPTETIEAGTTSSPVPSVGIGGFLEQFPPALFPSATIYDEPRQTATLAPPTPSVVEAASARISQQGGSLTESEMRHVLAEAGWPEALFSDALAVAFCESKWSPYALGDSGRSAGLFQLNLQTWFPYAKEDAERWADPLVNARVAWATYQYDIGRGYEPWRQWSCGFAAHN